MQGRNVLESRGREVQQLSTEFQILLKSYGELSFTSRDQQRFLEIFRNALNEVHKTIPVAMVGGHCPPGFKKCPNCDNCIPSDARSDCGRR